MLRMIKTAIILSFSMFWLAFPPVIDAKAIVQIDENGVVTSSVLGEQTSFLENKIKEIKSKVITEVERVVVATQGQSVDVTFKAKDEEETNKISLARVDTVTSYQDKSGNTLDVVKTPSGLAVSQGSVLAHTNYEIEIEPKTKAITLKTPTGIRYLNLLPADVYDLLIRSSVISELRQIEIVENAKGELLYVATGTKTFDLIKRFPLNAEVEAYVSATEGKLVNTKMPLWAELASFALRG